MMLQILITAWMTGYNPVMLRLPKMYSATDTRCQERADELFARRIIKPRVNVIIKCVRSDRINI